MPSASQVLGGEQRGLKAWNRKVVAYSLSHQLRRERNLVRKCFPNDDGRERYYAQVLKYSQEHLMMYPCVPSLPSPTAPLCATADTERGRPLRYHLSKTFVLELDVTP